MGDKKKCNITIVFKNNPNDYDPFLGGTHTIEIKEVLNYNIYGDNLIISREVDGGEINNVYNLKTIKSYKIWQ